MTAIDFEKLATGYLNHNVWFNQHGSHLNEVENTKIRNLAAKLQQKGVPEFEAYNQAAAQIDLVTHPNQDDAEEVEELCRNGDKNAFELIKYIVEKAPEQDEVLGYIGAGIFENWIQKADYEDFKSELHRLLETDRKWYLVIGNSWHNPQDLENKVKR